MRHSPPKHPRARREGVRSDGSRRDSRPRSKALGGARTASSAAARAIREAQQTRVALLRSTMDFARICVRYAEARTHGAAARSLQHAREGYELAKRLLSNNTILAASEASLHDELSSLRQDLEKAEAREH